MNENKFAKTRPSDESEDYGDITKTLYDEKGREHSKLDEDKIVAYSMEVKGVGRRYHIKFNLSGGVYNPHDSLAIYENQKQARIYGENPYRFHLVAKEVFDQYLSFIKTRDKTYLRNI